MNFPVVIFESDCKNLINFMDKMMKVPWETDAIAEDFKVWATSRRWTFVWCDRERETKGLTG
ncbi:hypothetical protein RHMOL_Rhmol09G0059400 [Rhododendron molle]|uniref:Uncharacterized protein n=1 Tax=Rhododendron molle TaxID=49168 RepID=A0ACC0MBW9_RHOML|nr:hypothetical protein RHMOL_Rhmol09G0059400 [Rhododendron molle]